MFARLAILILAATFGSATMSTLASAGSMVTCAYQVGEHAVPGYINSDGQCVPRPEANSHEGGLQATAQCRDGAYSYSQHRSGTCSGHGGVAQWMPAPASPAASTEPAEKVVNGTVWRCVRPDGVTQYSNVKCEGGTPLFTYKAKQAAR
jgi:hypothetical protein